MPPHPCRLKHFFHSIHSFQFQSLSIIDNDQSVRVSPKCDVHKRCWLCRRKLVATPAQSYGIGTSPSRGNTLIPTEAPYTSGLEPTLRPIPSSSPALAFFSRNARGRSSQRCPRLACLDHHGELVAAIPRAFHQLGHSLAPSATGGVQVFRVRHATHWCIVLLWVRGVPLFGAHYPASSLVQSPCPYACAPLLLACRV